MSKDPFGSRLEGSDVAPIAPVNEESWQLSAVVADLCYRAGLKPEMIDVSQLRGFVRGFMVSQNNSALDAIMSLAGAHLFDISSYGGKLHFIPRGGDVIAEIPLEDLVGFNDIDKRKREDAISVPLVLHMDYLSPNGEIDPIKQTSERSIDDRAVSESKIEAPDVITDQEAAQRVDILHKMLIEAQRGEFEFELTRKWLKLVVGDVIILDGERLRISAVSIDSNSQKYKALFDRQSAYHSDSIGLPFPEPPPPEDKTVENSVIEFLDLPLLDDDEDNLHAMLAVERTTVFWQGVSLDFSYDGGQSYFDSMEIVGDAHIGYLTLPAKNHDIGVWDNNTVLTVKLVDPRDNYEPYSKTQALNRQGLICIGDEIASYTHAEETGTRGVWELTGLIRGRKGTTAQAWPADTRVVLLDNSTYTDLPLQLYDLGRTFTVKATTFESDDDPEMLTFQPVGRSQIERAPARLKAVRNGSDLIVSWIGVGKIGGGFRVSMGRYFAGYRVTLGANVYNTNDMSITIPYAAGTLKVEQMNELTGAGIAAEIQV